MARPAPQSPFARKLALAFASLAYAADEAKARGLTDWEANMRDMMMTLSSYSPLVLDEVQAIKDELNQREGQRG